MELHQLRAFAAVARTGHLARASDDLHLTQSAVSKQLKALEEELGTLLFERGPAGMALTCAGRQLLPIAQHALDSVQQLAGAASSLRGVVAGPLRLGTIIDPESLKLGPMLASLLNFYPHVDVSLNHGISGTVLERLRAGLMRERLASQVIAQGAAAVWRGARVPCPLSLLWRRSRADSAVLRALAASVQRVWQIDADGAEAVSVTKNNPAGDRLT